MSSIVAQIGASIAFGLGLALSVPTAANAQSSAAERIEATQGSHLQTRARGRGPVVLHRGAPRHYSVPRRYGGHHYYGGPRYRSGRHIAGGIAAGIAGAIILNEITRPHYYYDGPLFSCAELETRCDAGQDWACRRLDNDPRC